MDSRKIAGGNESRRIAVKDSPGAPAYYPRLDHVAGRPYGVWVRGNDDTVAAASSVDKVATALSSTTAADVLETVGSSTPRRASAPTSWAARSPRQVI